MRIPNIFLASRKINQEKVEKNINRISATLHIKGIQTKDLLLIRSDQSLETLYWIIACFLRKQHFSILPHTLPQEEFSQKIEVLCPKAIVHAGSITSKAHSAHGEKNNAMVFLPTSGTSGRSKIVALSWENFKHSALAYGDRYAITHKDLWLCALPFHFIGGLSIVARSLLLGMDIAFTPKFTIDAVETFLKSHKITGLSLVPTMLDKLLKADSFSLLSSIPRWILVGGDGITKHVLNQVQQYKKKLPIYGVYGMTETCSQIACTQNLTTQQNPHLQPFPTISLRTDKDGELWVKGNTLALGEYYKGTVKKQTDTNGWLPTGDFATIFNDGSFSIRGRKSNIIISGGISFHPEEIESKILEFNVFADCAVFGLPDDYWGECVAAIYTSKSGKPLEEEELTNLSLDLKNRLSNSQIPKKFFFAQKLPQTPSGKISRQQLLNYSDAITPPIKNGSITTL